MENVAEEWRAVEGFEDAYEVSSFGRVRSLDRTRVVRHRNGKMMSRFSPGRILCPVEVICRGRLNHLRVTLSNGAFQKPFHVHVLVLRTFVGPPPPGQEGCHWDGDPSHNRLSNLRWDTRKGNVQDTVRHGTFAGRHHALGEACGKNKVTAEAVRVIRAEPEYRGATKMLARAFGFSETNVADIRKGRIWKHVEQHL